MGSCSSSEDKMNPSQVDKSHFDVQRVIGRGGFGKVNAAIKISEPNANVWYAMKTLQKHEVVQRDSYDEVLREMQFLVELKHLFLCNLYHAFQDVHNLYMIMDLAMGGDLRFRIQNTRRGFSTEQAKFYGASLVLALEYFRAERVLHRDLKPENIVMDGRGYIMVTDFGLSYRFATDEVTCKRTSGTNGYMAPEVFEQGHRHSFSADYFSLGVCLHEFVLKVRPYNSTSSKSEPSASSVRTSAVLGTFGDNIQLFPNHADTSNLPEDFKNLLRALTRSSPEERLGAASIEEIKGHPFFAGFDWSSLTNGNLTAPFIPDTTVANVDTGAHDLMETFGHERQPEIPTGAQERFEGYSYNTNIDAALSTSRALSSRGSWLTSSPLTQSKKKHVVLEDSDLSEPFA